MELIINDLKRIPKLFLGFTFVALGLLFSNLSNLGMLPWGVFHTGIENMTGIPFGNVVQLLGIIILILSIIFVKVNPGIGTFLNILFVGMIYEIIKGFNIISETDNITIRIAYLIIGIILSGFGTALYVSCKLGSGPRDGLFIGLSLITKLSVKHTKPIIEITVLIIGYLLKGDFGVGTFINAFTSGYVINFFFNLLKYDPKTSKQRKLKEYFSNHKKRDYMIDFMKSSFDLSEHEHKIVKSKAA